MERYIVKLKEGMWLVGGDGDPPRTLVMNNAKIYTYKQAERALKKARKLPYRDGYPDAKILKVHLSLETQESEFDSLEELSLENGVLKTISVNLLDICNQLLDKVITGQREKETVYGYNSEAWKAIKAIEQSLKTIKILLGITEGK